MTAIMPPSPPPFAHLKSSQSRCSLLQTGGVGKTRIRVTPRVRVRVKVGGEGEREGMDNEKATPSVRKDFIIRPATGF